VHASVQGGMYMIYGGAAGLMVDWRVLEEQVGATFLDEIEVVAHRNLAKGDERFSCLDDLGAANRIQAGGMDGAAVSGGSNASDTEGEVVLLLEQVTFAFEQPYQGAGDVTKANESELVVHFFS
jgi:hypothetical protein